MACIIEDLYQGNPNLPEAILNTSFDWNGDAVKKATGYSIEGKAKDAEGNPVMKQWFDVTEADQKTIMDATEWCAADNGYFRGGGFSSRFVTRAEMPATMIRLNIIKGLGPVLQIAEGWTVCLPDGVTDKLWKRTDYTWPCTMFLLRRSSGRLHGMHSVWTKKARITELAQHTALFTRASDNCSA